MSLEMLQRSPRGDGGWVRPAPRASPVGTKHWSLPSILEGHSWSQVRGGVVTPSERVGDNELTPESKEAVHRYDVHIQPHITPPPG